MTKTKTVIEINGKRYDAVNGHALSSSNSQQQGVKVIDGVVRGKPSAVQLNPATPSQAAPVAIRAAASPVMDMHQTRRATPMATPKKHMPQSSHTLMRQAVNKPAASFKKSHKSHTRTDVLARQPSATIAPKLSFHAVDAKREVRAKHIGQSKLISRFGSVALPEHKHIAAATIAAKPLPKVTAVATAANIVEPLPLPSRQPGSALFERALLKATSHEQQTPKSNSSRRHSRKSTHRLASASALSIAVLILGGFFVYQNMANITIRLAASKAGFAAALPGYRPAGFAIGKFAYSPGDVTIRFHSNSDSNRSFALIEQPSNWDSTTLMNYYVSTTTGNSYQTATAAGRTIYLYGNNNATWVSGGVWYRVENQNGLSTAQLVDLASSM